jgi:hypothetical protein
MADVIIVGRVAEPEKGGESGSRLTSLEILCLERVEPVGWGLKGRVLALSLGDSRGDEDKATDA